MKLVCLAIWVCLVCGSANAHTRSQTNAILTADASAVRLSLSIEAREVTRITALPGLGIALERAMRLHFLKEIRIEADGKICPAAAPEPAFAATMRLEIAYACPPNWKQLDLQYDAFFEVARGHIAILHAEVDGQPRGEAVLSKLSRNLRLPRVANHAPARPSGVLSFVRMGVEHILEGLDHICFVLGLLLIARSVRPAALTLTGFTLGHSVTLALGALDLIRVNPHSVETLVAVTIICVGLEALRAQGGSANAVKWAMLCGVAILAAGAAAGAPVWLAVAGVALVLGAGFSSAQTNHASWRRPFIFAAGFGLVHGLAFAETLREVLTPGGGLLWALLGFNLGVELGQLIVASLAMGLFMAWSAWRPISAAIGAYVSACLLLFAGAAWLAARLPFA